MSNREELGKDLYCLLQGRQVDDLDSIYQEIIVILGKYEVEERTTEVAICDQDINTMLVQKWLVSKKVKGCTPRTLQIYKQSADFFLGRVNKSIPDITADDIRLYMAVREARDKVSRVTINNERRFLSSMFTFLYTEELIRRNPMSKIDMVKVRKKKKKAFTDIEIEEIRMACRSNRERCIIEMLLSTWCRLSELVGIRLGEIDGDKVIVHGKGNKDRICYLNAKAQLALKMYLAERNDDNPWLFPRAIPRDNGMLAVFSKYGAEWYKHRDLIDQLEPASRDSFGAIIRDIGKKAGVNDTHPHRFRRTGATMALRKGMPIEQVSRLLGHEQLTTTQIYLDMSEDETENMHRKYVT